MAKFDLIMQHLNPRVIIAKTEVPHDTARGKYVLKSSVVFSALEFEAVVIEYVSHHMQEVFGNHLPPEYCFNKAKHFLESSTGFDNATYIGLSGTEGGMNFVLTQITEGFKMEAKQAYFEYVLNTYIDRLNIDEILELMREMKDKLGVYSPLSFRYVKPEAMALSYRDFLWKYIDSLTKYKNLWAY